MLVITAALTSCAPTANIEQEEAALMAVGREWGKTGGDIDKFTSFLAPDARLSYWGAPAIEGEDAIRTAIGSLMETPNFKMTWQPARATVAASGDLGYTIGAFTMVFQNSAGMTITENGKQQTTWKKIDGVWKVIEDTGTSDAPLPVLSQPAMVSAADVKWLDGPPTLPAGTKLAILSGDPSADGPFTVRVRFPAGARIAPHWHPTDEHVTVLAGTIAVGMGRAWNGKAMSDLSPGSYVVTAATMPHFALARTATTIQVSGLGPFVQNYVNPGDDPSKHR